MSLPAWIQASRPLALANIAPPLLFGQGLAFAICGTFRWTLFAWLLLFGALLQLVLVFANDAADWRTDVENRTFNRFSGGSRVVPEGKLTPFQLARGALLALVAMSLVCAYLVLVEHRLLMMILGSFAVLIFWAYSFKPFLLSYRGHGELLQALGVGVLLPFIGYYVQCNDVTAAPWLAFVPSFVLGYAGNVTTALPDAPSDAKSGKRSYPVRRGERTARRDSLLLIAAAACAAPLAVPGAPLLAAVVLAAVPLALLATSVPLLDTADAVNRRVCERFVLLSGAAGQAALAGWIVALFAGIGGL